MTDTERAVLAARGDIDAFDQLYTKYDLYLRRQIAKVTGPHERALRQDAAQQVWADLVDDRWRIDPTRMSGDLYAFLRVLARRTVARLRRPDRRPMVSLDAFGDDADD